jgi:hypothetical protein
MTNLKNKAKCPILKEMTIWAPQLAKNTQKIQLEEVELICLDLIIKYHNKSTKINKGKWDQVLSKSQRRSSYLKRRLVATKSYIYHHKS